MNDDAYTLNVKLYELFSSQGQQLLARSDPSSPPAHSFLNNFSKLDNLSSEGGK